MKMEQVTNEKALQYAQGKLDEALTNAIATAYADGYKAGYADGEKNKPAEVSPAIETKTNFVDLGLPSGTLWADDYENDSNGKTLFLPFKEAENYNLPTKKHWNELCELCKIEKDNAHITVVGPNGEIIKFKVNGFFMDHAPIPRSCVFWLQDDSKTEGHKEIAYFKYDTCYTKRFNISSSSHDMQNSVAVRQIK